MVKLNSKFKENVGVLIILTRYMEAIIGSMVQYKFSYQRMLGLDNQIRMNGGMGWTKGVNTMH